MFFSHINREDNENRNENIHNTDKCLLKSKAHLVNNRCFVVLQTFLYPIFSEVTDNGNGLASKLS